MKAEIVPEIPKELPAFPMHPDNATSFADARGMTLRDYFAAHAPAEIPTWFGHVPPAKDFPPMPAVEALDEAHRKEAISWRQDPCFDLPEEIAWWGEKVKAHRNARAAWEEANVRAQYVQWRYAYADMMLKQRSRS